MTGHSKGPSFIPHSLKGGKKTKKAPKGKKPTKKPSKKSRRPHKKSRKGGMLGALERAIVPFGLLALQKKLQKRKSRKNKKSRK